VDQPHCAAARRRARPAAPRWVFCFTTRPDGKTDNLVYHARNYKDAGDDPLGNPDRATRVQVIRWRPDGTPDFGPPIADGPVR